LSFFSSAAAAAAAAVTGRNGLAVVVQADLLKAQG
jgi:hypothetical protein